MSKNIVPTDVLNFLIQTYPANVARLCVDHYRQNGELPQRLRIQTDLKGGCAVYSPAKAYGLFMFSKARQALKEGVTTGGGAVPSPSF